MKIWAKKDDSLVRVVVHPKTNKILHDVIILVGQSNMRGVAPYEVFDQYEGVFMWDHDIGQVVQAVEPLSSPFPTPGMGAGNTFIKQYKANDLPYGHRLLVINTAVGGTGFTTPSSTPQGSNFHWRYDLPNDENNLAQRALSTIEQVLSRVSDPRIVAILANHGSSDGSKNVPKETFKTYLEDWITWFRSSLDITAPYLMMQMRPDLIANETRHRIIDEAQTEVANEMANVIKGISPINPEAYAEDSVHFSAIGMRAIGLDLYSRYKAAGN